MVVSTLSGVLLIAILTQLFKGFLEAFGLKPTSAFHDPIIWLIAFGGGIGGYIVSAAITAPLTGPIVRDAAGQGLLAAFSAVGAYHLVTHPYFDTVGAFGRDTAGTPLAPYLGPPMTVSAPSVFTSPDKPLNTETFPVPIPAQTIVRDKNSTTLTTPLPPGSIPTPPGT